mmetsp:Transcript_3028/g.1713  ORF Transcript_3028/g.1713 Transcript_3028/m.1713 type:complete len:215 (-) Transcript_3028:1112-1756(-)
MQVPDFFPTRPGGDNLPLSIIRQLINKYRDQVRVDRHTTIHAHYKRQMGIPFEHAVGFVYGNTAHNSGIKTLKLWNDVMSRHHFKKTVHLFHRIIEKGGRPSPLTVFTNFKVVQRTGIASGHFGRKGFQASKRTRKIVSHHPSAHANNHIRNPCLDGVQNIANRFYIPCGKGTLSFTLITKMAMCYCCPHVIRLEDSISHFVRGHRHVEFYRIG